MQQLYVIIAYDSPDAGDARTKFRDGHLEHFRNIADSIKVAGPVFREDGSSAGSLIIVEAADSEAARNMIARDPFYTERVWSRIDVKAFKAASGDWASV